MNNLIKDLIITKIEEVIKKAQQIGKLKKSRFVSRFGYYLLTE